MRKPINDEGVRLRVASTSSGAYNFTIYGGMQSTEVFRFPPAHTDVTQRPDLAKMVGEFESLGPDVLHLHWPEWLIGPFLADHERFIEFVKTSNTPILWTLHNRRPHMVQDASASASERKVFEDIYNLWAQAADGAVHLSKWGMKEIRRQYEFSPRTKHRVILHPHFGTVAGDARLSKDQAQSAVGLPPCSIRLGIVGAPRANKSVQLVLDAFAGTQRNDMQLVVFSLDGSERVPADSRIVTFLYEKVPRIIYDARLQSLDALIMPFEDGMLVTGTASDAVAFGLPAIVSDWPYLREALGDGGIVYGSGVADLRRTLESLDPAALASSKSGILKMQAATDPGFVSREMETFLFEITGRPHAVDVTSGRTRLP